MKAFAVIFLATMAMAIRVEPPTPIWGGALAYQIRVNMTDISDAPEHPQWFFNYSYMADLDSNATYSRYDMDIGQHDIWCKGIEGAPELGERCTILHSIDNWMVISYPDYEFCCKCTQNIGAVRYDWLRNSLSKYEGTVKSDVNGEPFPTGVDEADTWFEQGMSDNHYYVTTDKTQTPIRYLEHKNDKLKQWDFIAETYNIRDDWTASDELPSIFALPDNCSDRCKAWFCRI